MGPGMSIFSRFCFSFVSKQLKCLDLANFLHVSGDLVFSHFPDFCFSFVSKRLEMTETFGLSQFSSCFSPFQ